MEASLPIPVLLVGNVYVFSGHPEAVQAAVRRHQRALPRVAVSRARHVYVRARESTFAHHLEAVMTAFPRPDAGLLSRGG